VVVVWMTVVVVGGGVGVSSSNAVAGEDVEVGFGTWGTGSPSIERSAPVAHEALSMAETMTRACNRFIRGP